MKAIILAGGYGTRLRPITNDLIPKCLVEVMEKPLLYYIVRNMKKQGIKDITLALYHHADQFMDFCYRESVKYKIEDAPLGTGGAIKNCIEGAEPVLVCNGDTVMNIDYNDMISQHIPPLTVAVMTNKAQMVSAGVYIINPELFMDAPLGAFSFETFIMTKLKKFYKVDWFTDAGTPDGYEQVKADVKD